MAIGGILYVCDRYFRLHEFGPFGHLRCGIDHLQARLPVTCVYSDWYRYTVDVEGRGCRSLCYDNCAAWVLVLPWFDGFEFGVGYV